MKTFEEMSKQEQDEVRKQIKKQREYDENINEYQEWYQNQDKLKGGIRQDDTKDKSSDRRLY